MQFGPTTPMFIVSNLEASLHHYVELLGFTCTYSAPDTEPFFALVARGSAQFMLKVTEDHVEPVPNATLHEWAGLDAFVYVSDPETIANEFAERGVTFKQPLGETDDNLLGFQVEDPDGYVSFFGRPQT